MVTRLIGYGYGRWRGPEADLPSWTGTFHDLAINDGFAFVCVFYIHNAGYLGRLIGLILALMATASKKRGTSPLNGDNPKANQSLGQFARNLAINDPVDGTGYHVVNSSFFDT